MAVLSESIPRSPREAEALAAGCSCSLLDMIEMPYVCSPKPGSIQQLVSAAWLSAGSVMKLPSLQPYSSRLLMFAAAACFKAAEAGSDVTRY